MSRGVPLKKGMIVGHYEIIDKVFNGKTDKYGFVYRALCLNCGAVVLMGYRQLSYRKNRGCKNHEQFEEENVNRQNDNEDSQMWMTEEEIYREWKGSKDRRQAYKILAQLNDVPINVIYSIIDHKQMQEKRLQNL